MWSYVDTQNGSITNREWESVQKAPNVFGHWKYSSQKTLLKADSDHETLGSSTCYSNIPIQQPQNESWGTCGSSYTD